MLEHTPVFWHENVIQEFSCWLAKEETIGSENLPGIRNKVDVCIMKSCLHWFWENMSSDKEFESCSL